MAKTRRQFLANAAMGVVAAAVSAQTQEPSPNPQTTPGAPTTFGAAPPVGPKVTPEDFEHAEKLVQVTMTAQDRAQAAGNWQQSMAALYERRVGPRKVALGYNETPATIWVPLDNSKTLSDNCHGTAIAGDFLSPPPAAPALPARDHDIAFAGVTQLADWLRTRALTSERLTRIYLARLKQYQPVLNCTITLCEEHALQQARQADREIAAGKYRGPLHGMPWGAKDLLDTAGIPTTWGAEPFRNRIPAEDAEVTALLNEAGAVLVAKLSLGALALNDVWFGGQTKNPWCVEEGSSGSSAGPASAVAAGLVAFAIGSETQGSIISPSMRCGVTGLRPTYGRVSTKGAMTLSWTCDKLGPLARHVEDVQTVLAHLSPTRSLFRLGAPSSGLEALRVGYIPKWLQEAPATDVDRHALEVLKQLGVQAVPVELPDWPYDSLNAILFAESAAAFEEITLNHQVDELKMQVPDAWPNTFRQSRFISAVDFVQADRLRRKVALEVARVMQQVDFLLVPSLRDEPLVIFNFTGHPSLTLRAGFVEIGEERSDWAPDPAHPPKKFSPPRRVPYGVTLIGRLYDEGTIAQVGIALEKAFNVAGERPKGFA